MNFRKILKEIKDSQSTVLVVGLGISGIETARFLSAVDIDCICVEKEERASFFSRTKFQAELEALAGAGVRLEFGVAGEKVGEFLAKVKLCVLSPGVSLETPICAAIKRRGVPLVSELELATELLNQEMIVVTGSNGKTTTVNLIFEMLKHAGREVELCGNVGIPVISKVKTTNFFDKEPNRAGFLVVEASSYQLEICQQIKPRVGVFLNISENHLERHGTMRRYFEAKANLFRNQDSEDFALLNLDDKLVQDLGARTSGTCLGFGLENQIRAAADGAFIRYNPGAKVDELLLKLLGKEEIYQLSKSHLLGLHNRYDLAAAVLASRLVGVERADIEIVIGEFMPLEHRLEFVPLGSGPLWVNDSKSTTVAATMAAIDAVGSKYQGKRINLLIGGLAKAGSWEPLISKIASDNSRFNPVVCFGADGKLLSDHLVARGLPTKIARNVAEAVCEVKGSAGPDEIVLFSPGCASFDEFSDFEHRGRVFKEQVCAALSTKTAA